MLLIAYIHGELPVIHTALSILFTSIVVNLFNPHNKLMSVVSPFYRWGNRRLGNQQQSLTLSRAVCILLCCILCALLCTLHFFNLLRCFPIQIGALNKLSQLYQRDCIPDSLCSCLYEYGLLAILNQAMFIPDNRTLKLHACHHFDPPITSSLESVK